MIDFFKKILNDYIPRHSRKLLIFVLIYDFMVYYGGRLISTGLHHYNMTTELDLMIPLIPSTVIIYFGCYLFWGINYILCTRFSREQAVRFLGADLLGKTVCFLFFVFLPTTMVRPEITGTGLLNDMMRMLYSCDSADNLFPSIHCFVSWLCYIGMRGDERYPSSYRLFSMIFALLVCISTLTTRQHVISDVLMGVVLAEICYWVMGNYKKVLRR